MLPGSDLGSASTGDEALPPVLFLETRAVCGVVGDGAAFLLVYLHVGSTCEYHNVFESLLLVQPLNKILKTFPVMNFTALHYSSAINN